MLLWVRDLEMELFEFTRTIPAQSLKSINEQENHLRMWSKVRLSDMKISV